MTSDLRNSGLHFLGSLEGCCNAFSEDRDRFSEFNTT